jgi:hypothetical protein
MAALQATQVPAAPFSFRTIWIYEIRTFKRPEGAKSTSHQMKIQRRHEPLKVLQRAGMPRDPAGQLPARAEILRAN